MTTATFGLYFKMKTIFQGSAFSKLLAKYLRPESMIVRTFLNAPWACTINIFTAVI